MGQPGDWIRQLREQRGFTREQVEALTTRWAELAEAAEGAA